MSAFVYVPAHTSPRGQEGAKRGLLISSSMRTARSLTHRYTVGQIEEQMSATRAVNIQAHKGLGLQPSALQPNHHLSCIRRCKSGEKKKAARPRSEHKKCLFLKNTMFTCSDTNTPISLKGFSRFQCSSLSVSGTKWAGSPPQHGQPGPNRKVCSTHFCSLHQNKPHAGPSLVSTTPGGIHYQSSVWRQRGFFFIWFSDC